MRQDILVPFVTYPDANTDALVDRAIAVATFLGRDIHAVALEVDIPDVSNLVSRLLIGLPDMIRRTEADSRARGAALLGAIEAAATRAGIRFAGESASAEPALFGDRAAELARYHDLSVVGLSASNDSARMVAEGIVFGSGRPALLVPEAAPPGAFDRIAIAWDGSRVAARAVTDAQPFLERAGEIVVLTVTDDKPLADAGLGTRLAAGLAARGLTARAVSALRGNRPIAAALQADAAAHGAGLLVMGGYGHSRLRDFVLGGATEGVLSEPTMSVLLSH
ncbi:MAG TPA: universal stress protein [Rhizobiales bacterium]|nr:universal stress protein [Hyphomicrobiales bacterium]